MFFLPLPLKKTLETLDEVKCSSSRETALPDPELYIINGKPTSSKIVWRTLLNVEHVREAIQKLKDINSEVDDESIDGVSKKGD